MPHVTFIHGIANKPPLDDLLRIWRDTLADAADIEVVAEAGDLKVLEDSTYGSVIARVKNLVSAYAA